MANRAHSLLEIAGVVALYWVVSISMIFANKYLVGEKFSETEVSLFVAWVQCLTSVLMSVFSNTFRRRFLGESSTLPPLKLDLLRNRNVCALCVTFTGMLSFNNLCLKYVGIAFFQVARSMTLIFTVILSAVMLRKIASYRVWLCCLLVVCGFGLGVDQEKLAGTISYRGVVYGLTTSIFIAMNGVLTKRVLDLVEGNTVSVAYYMNIGASVLFIPILLITGQMQTAVVEKVTQPLFMGLLMFSGVLGFFICIASNLQIAYTSPITHHISNNAKSVVQTLLAVMIFKHEKSFLWWCSNGLVIAGALSYTITRMREESAAKLAAAANKEPVSIPEKSSMGKFVEGNVKKSESV